jgi:hypothetical protein
MSFGRKLLGIALLLTLIATLTLPIHLQPLTTNEPPVLQSDGGEPPAPPIPLIGPNLPASTVVLSADGGEPPPPPIPLSSSTQTS